jgi:hypothetical protein
VSLYCPVFYIDQCPRTEVGQLAESIVSRGGLIPDDIMLKIVTSELDSLNNKVSNFFYWFTLSLLIRVLALDSRWVPSNTWSGKDAQRPSQVCPNVLFVAPNLTLLQVAVDAAHSDCQLGCGR